MFLLDHAELEVLLLELLPESVYLRLILLSDRGDLRGSYVLVLGDLLVETSHELVMGLRRDAELVL